jgi:hypothetical protein
VKITEHKIKVFAAQLLVCLSFGFLFFILEETGQAWFVATTTSCCERCNNYLFDRAQPVLALCAALACLFYLRRVIFTVSLLRYLLFTIIYSVVSFMGYFVFMGVTIFLRMECTALYSPGPGFMHSIPIGGPIVGIVVALETMFWSLSCMILLLVLGGIVKSVWQADVVERPL